MSSRKVTKRQRALARAQKRNILLREGDPTRTTEQQLAESRVSKRERLYQEREMAKKLAAAKKQARAHKGGMPERNANIDYRKSGMFYVGGMSAKPTKINKGKK